MKVGEKFNRGTTAFHQVSQTDECESKKMKSDAFRWST